MSTRISSLPGAATLTGAERFIVSQPDPAVTRTSTTCSVSASDNSFNDASADYVALGFAVGMGIGSNGAVNGANNMQNPSGVISAVTATKITVVGVTLVDEAAGASIVLTQWMSRQLDLATLLIESGSSGITAPEVWGLACSDETTAITTGVKHTFVAPYAFLIEDVKASLTTAQASGALFTVDIKVAGVSMFSTLLTFDNTEQVTFSAVTPRVLSPNPYTVAGNALVTVEVTQVGDGTAKGLKVYLIGRFVLG